MAEAEKPATPRTGSMYSRMKEKYNTAVYDPPEVKVEKARAKVVEAKEALAKAKERDRHITEVLKKETDEFHVTTRADFQNGLRKHVEEQMALEEETQRKWQAVKEAFEQVPDV